MDHILNFNLMKHPLNWVTVATMLLIVGYVAHLFLDWHTNKTADGSVSVNSNS